MIRGISTHCFVRVCIRLSIADADTCQSCNPYVASPSHQHLGNNPHSLHCRHQPTALLRTYIGEHRRSIGLTSRRDGHRRRLPRLVRPQSPGVCSIAGASTYSAALGLNRISTVLATPSVSVPLNLQLRRVRSRSRALRQGGLAMFPAVSFLFAVFRIWEYEPWLIFPVQS